MAIIYQNHDEAFTARLTRDNSYSLHLHRQVELFYVLEGSIEISIHTESCTLTKGMLSIAFPDTIHKTETPQGSLALMLIFSPELLPDFHPDFMNQMPKNPFISDCSRIPGLTENIMELLENAQNNRDIRLLKGCLYLILARLMPNLCLTPQTYVKPDICQEIAQYLNHHYTDSIDLSSLSSALGYSRFHISHIFKEKFGCSFSDYLNRLRAEHAMGLLTHSDLSITEICFASGFHSLRTFYRTFEKVYGRSPGHTGR